MRIFPLAAKSARALRALSIISLNFVPGIGAAAQVVSRDSARTDTTRAQRLERVTVSAVRS